MDPLRDAQIKQILLRADCAAAIDTCSEMWRRGGKDLTEALGARARSEKDMLSCSVAVSAISLGLLGGAPPKACQAKVEKFKARLACASVDSLDALSFKMELELMRAQRGMSDALGSKRDDLAKALSELESAVAAEAIRRAAPSEPIVLEKAIRL